MYLPSRIKSKYFLIFSIAIILLILPLGGFFKNLLLFSTTQLTLTPKKNLPKLRDLEKTNLSLRLTLNKLQKLQSENLRLKNAFNFMTTNSLDLLGAEVISFSPSSWRKEVLVSAGENHGIKKGSFAIDADGNLLGKITDTEANRSQLLLVSDPNFNLSVFIGEVEVGLLKGNLENAKILYVENNSQIEESDKVWIKDPGSTAIIEIGEILRIRKTRNSLFWDVTVRIYNNGNFLNEIFILR